MSEMRKLINLFEGTVEPPMDPEQDSGPEGMGNKLQGVAYVDPSIFDGYFPSIDDHTTFYRAWRKAVANREETLNRQELWELGRAFVDLIRMSEQEKLSFIRKIILIHMPPGSEDEETTILGPGHP